MHSAYLKLGSQSQYRVFREAMAESMLFVLALGKKNNSIEIAPFRQGAGYPLERVAQRFYSVPIKSIHLRHLVRHMDIEVDLCWGSGFACVPVPIDAGFSSQRLV